MRPRLLDLFCGAGGAAMGYHQAGFDVIGVDIEPQPNYPFEFVQADALDVLTDGSLADLVASFDAIHASPPCHDHTTVSNIAGLNGSGALLGRTIEELARLGRPFVVENVPGARKHMPGAFTLCGRSFGVRRLRRHRLFLVNFPIMVMPCACDGSQPLGIYGDLSKNDRKVTNTKDGIVRMRAGVQSARDLLKCPWMNAKELSQAIPPAYTEYIGAQLLSHLSAAVGVEGDVA